ncbi:MAG TPA: DinB family protein [Ignavibacteria bacterium]
MAETNSNPQVALLKWMLEDIRKVTLAGINHLAKEQLFTPPIEGEFPIGSYLMHFAECDLGWLEVISGIKPLEEIKKRSYYATWFDSPDSNPPIEPLEISEYLEVLDITRGMFLDFISTIKDSELEDIITHTGIHRERRHSKKCIIYNILTHEAHTRGQIFMLIRKAGWNKK